MGSGSQGAVCVTQRSTLDLCRVLGICILNQCQGAADVSGPRTPRKYRLRQFQEVIKQMKHNYLAVMPLGDSALHICLVR